jgi:hypothetical protein
MVRASRHTIVTCEEIIESRQIRSDPERTTLPHIYISAVVHQPWGAHPTSTYRYYDFDAEHLRFYQECARAGGEQVKAYLDRFVFGSESFQDYLEKVGGKERLVQLEKAMKHLCASTGENP